MAHLANLVEPKAIELFSPALRIVINYVQGGTPAWDKLRTVEDSIEIYNREVRGGYVAGTANRGFSQLFVA